jgi:hypothetical protein
MMSCAMCSKWQHILCHNKRDQAAGHPTRNWDSVEFICQRCRAYQLDRSGADSMLTTKQPTLQQSDTLQAAALYTMPDTLQPSGSFPRGHEGPFRGSYDRRPNGVDQSLSAQGHFLSSALFSTSDIYDPPSASTPRQMISFNHYQPTEDGFSSSTQKAYRADSHPVYGNQQQHHTSLRCYL